MSRTFESRLRTLLKLGRVSNLPTVVSNCLAGWWLSGGGNFPRLPALFLGTCLLYLGGMFLNDAFDAEVDRQRRKSRPIPAGEISEAEVWRMGWSLLALGIFCLLMLGILPALLAVVLAICILVYNVVHKAFTASPWVMSLCRFMVYVIAGTTGTNGLSGWPIWCGAALAFYIAGLSYVARRESFRAPVPYWPVFLLAAPITLALLMNTGISQKSAVVASLISGLWICRCVWTIFRPDNMNVGRIVSGLLAGIVFVDWMAVAPDCPRALTTIYLTLFCASLALQRLIPAT